MTCWVTLGFVVSSPSLDPAPRGSVHILLLWNLVPKTIIRMIFWDLVNGNNIYIYIYMCIYIYIWTL